MATDEALKPSTLPPYPELIMAAIAAVGDKAGAGESSISKHIESAYEGSLPESHSSLLSEHLARMRDDGELVFADGLYSRAGADEAPAKRGRGRPPKPKSDAAPPKPSGPPRPRGRPPKPKDPLAAAVAKVNSGLPRRRGRPPKKRPAVAAAGVPVAVAAGGVVKRGRGRPPKVKPAVENDVA